MDHSSKASIHESVSVIKMKSRDTIVYEQDCHVFIMIAYSAMLKCQISSRQHYYFSLENYSKGTHYCI